MLHQILIIYELKLNAFVDLTIIVQMTLDKWVIDKCAHISRKLEDTHFSKISWKMSLNLPS